MKSTVVAFLFLTTIAFAETPPLFQQLHAGDSIHVSYTSVGCFHSMTYEFEFHQAAGVRAKITEVEVHNKDTAKSPQETKRTLLGTVALTGPEVAGLDRLFEFYREKERGGCTTHDQIKATYKIAGVTMATEFFTDNTCASYEARNMTHLQAIVAKLKKKSE